MDYLTTMVDFQPILVGAGCLALGYVYGRHCRSLSEMQASAPMASEDCCAQSQSNTYQELERCKCCMSAPAALDAMEVKNLTEASCPKESHDPEEAERPERCTKRDLGQLDVLDRHACHMMMLREKEDTAPTQTPYKKQKSAAGTTSWSKDKAEMDIASSDERVGDDGGDPTAVPWSQEVLNQRIDYFNKVISEAGASIDEARKLSPYKNSTVITTSEEAKDTSIDSRKSISDATVRSSTGLGALATPMWDPADCSLDETCISPKGEQDVDNNGGEAEEPAELGYFDPMPENETEQGRSYMGDPLESNLGHHVSFDAVPDADFVMRYTLREPDVSALGMDVNEGDLEAAMEADVPLGDQSVQLRTEVFMRAELRMPTSPAAEHHVQDRCLEESELMTKPQVPVDRVLKAEIYELLNEADCGKVSFEEIVSLLEEKLHVDLREDKAHIVSLVREVISISKILEEERALEASDQETAFHDCSLNY